MSDLRVPPLVGTFGRAGTGKTSDKLRAFPRAYFFANPGGLVPAISEVGITPRSEDINAVADIDMLRARAEVVLKRDKTIDTFVIDDLSMIASKTERTLKGSIKDGRALYGAVKERMGNLFDTWRNYGITVAVDAHEQPPVWKTNDEGVELPHTVENRVSPGMPNLPGRQSAPEMVKAFDMFYRVVQGQPDLLNPSAWPWRYKAGPWLDGVDWETKDRWSVARGSVNGLLPLNLGEILRFVVRKHKVAWKVHRPLGYEGDEDLVAWGANTIMADSGAGAAVFGQIAKAVLDKPGPKGSGTIPTIDPYMRISWLKRDIQARVELEQMHSPAAKLRDLGITLPA